MGAHFAAASRHDRRQERRHQIAALSVALGVGLLGFTYLDGDGRTAHDLLQPLPSSTEPSVLGVTIERDDAVPPAPAASPATFDADLVGPPTTRRPATTTTTRSSPETSTTADGSTSTTGPAELIPPVVIESSTTTESTTTTEASEQP